MNPALFSTLDSDCRRSRHFLSRSLLALLIALALAVPVNAHAAKMKPQPSGLYDLLFGAPGTGRIDLTDNPLLDNPYVDGFRYKVGWAKIQPDNASTFNWDSIDAAIAIAAAHGKKMCLSIASGYTTPDWVYTTAPVVYKYNMKEKDSEGLSVGTQPLPWDTAFQAKWKTFIAAFAARYESNPACSYVVIGGFMPTFNLQIANIDDDVTALTKLAQHPPSGYPGLVTSYPDFDTAYLSGAKSIISSYATNFATTSLVLTLTSVLRNDDGVALQNTLDAWAKETYPDHLGSMVSALYATVPPHGPPANVTFPKGFQMVCHTSDASRLYIDPDPVPLPPVPIPLQDALEHGVTLGAKYIEVYEDDLVDPLSQSVMATEQTKLYDNTSGDSGPPPGPPAPPKNLHFL